LLFAINDATAALLRYHSPHAGMPPLLAALARNDCLGAVITSRQGSGKQPDPIRFFSLPPLLSGQPGRAFNLAR